MRQLNTLYTEYLAIVPNMSSTVANWYNQISGKSYSLDAHKMWQRQTDYQGETINLEIWILFVGDPDSTRPDFVGGSLGEVQPRVLW